MIELVLAATLLLRDPPGDAIGAGGLVPPSAEQYRNVGSFDLLEVQILESSMLALTIEMGALPNPAGLANGFSNAVIDVYVDLGEGGTEALLPGPEMRMPPGRGWEVALRITGDGATAYRSDDDPAGAGPSVSYPVRVQAEGRVIRVETPFERPEIEGIYALTGVYDPFVASGWRPLSEVPSPWAFASEDPRRPVIDLLASDEVVQAEAIRSGVLPTPRNRTAGAMWMLLMAVGVLVAGVGLVLRRMVGPRVATPRGRATVTGTAPDAEASEPAVEPPSELGPDATPEPPTVPPSVDSGDPTPQSMPPALPGVVIPTFLPALPPARAATQRPGSGDIESGGPQETAAADRDAESEDEPAAGARREEGPERAETLTGASRASTAFGGAPDSWLDEDPEADPDARTWRGDPDRTRGADEPEPRRGQKASSPDDSEDASPAGQDPGDERDT